MGHLFLLFSQPQDTFLSFVVLCIKNNHLGPIICILFSLDLRRENCCYWPNELPFPTISTKEVSLIFPQTFLYQHCLWHPSQSLANIYMIQQTLVEGQFSSVLSAFLQIDTGHVIFLIIRNLKWSFISCLNGDFVCITVVPYWVIYFLSCYYQFSPQDAES